MVIIQDLIGAVISVDVGSAEMATPISIYGQKSTFFGKGVESYSLHQNISNFDTNNFYHHWKIIGPFFLLFCDFAYMADLVFRELRENERSKILELL